LIILEFLTNSHEQNLIELAFTEMFQTLKIRYNIAYANKINFDHTPINSINE